LQVIKAIKTFASSALNVIVMSCFFLGYMTPLSGETVKYVSSD